MRSYLSTLCIFFGFCAGLSAQCDDGKITNEVWGTIQNNHRANTTFTYGMVSYQFLEDNFYYDSPEDSLFYLGYGKSLWAAAKDQAGNLKVSANTYPSITTNDFVPGPLDRATGLPLDTTCNIYNRVWKVTQFEIFNLQQQFQDGTLTLADIPLDILEWPALGNPHMDELSPDFELAPFNDVAEDGIYDPMSGDHPIVLEENPDFIPAEFTFVVYNDVTRHTTTGSTEINLEFHQTNYVVNCGEDTESDHTVYTRIKYLYLGDETLSELKLSLFEDNDLACNLNDYTGCDLDLNCSYFYNEGGETFVGSCHDFDVPDDNGAIRSTIFLSHEMKTFKHFYLLGIGDTLAPGTDPQLPQEYYNFMTGLWRDGVPQTRGGSGYDPASTDFTLFAYPDRPDLQGWSMETAGINTPLDVRALTTLVDETQVAPGSTGVIDFADHFLYEPDQKKLTVFQDWPDKINKLKTEFASMQDGTFQCTNGLEECVADCVWPGDVNRDKGVTAKDYLYAGVLAGQNISDGIPRAISSTDWFGFNADNWSVDLHGINAKNADVNGNGVINQIDLQGIDANFGLNRDDFIYGQEILVPQAGSNILDLVLADNDVDVATAQLFDRIIELEIYLNGPSSNTLSPEIHGLSFDMRFDTNMITPFVILTSNGNQVFQHDFAYMNDQYRGGPELRELRGDNKIQYAFTNYNGISATEGGQLVGQNIYVKDEAATSNPDGRDTVIIKFYNVCAVDANGDEMPMDASYDTLYLSNLAIDPDLTSGVKELSDLQVELYPNPVNEVLNVELEEPVSGRVTVFDLNGKILDNSLFEKGSATLSLDNYPAGVYYLRVRTDSGELVIESFVKEGSR